MNILNNKLKAYLYFYWTMQLAIAILAIASIFIIGLLFPALADGDWKLFLNYFYIELGITTCIILLTIGSSLFKNYLVKRISQEYQKYFIENSYTLQKNAGKIKAGDVTSKVLKTIPNIIEFTIFQLGNFFVSILVLIAIISVLSYYSIIIMFITVGAVLLLLLSTLFISKWVSLKTSLQQKTINNLDGEFDIFLSSFHKFFFFFKTAFLNFKLKEINGIALSKLNKLNEEISILGAINIFFNIIFQLLLTTVVLVLYMNDILPLSSVASIPFLFGLTSQYFQEVSSSLASYRSFIKLKNELFPTSNIKVNKISEIKKLEFKEFNFGKNKNQYTKNIDWIFEQNKKYLIVGESGAGKSLLLSQLFLNEKQYHGEIFINDVEKSKYIDKDIMKHILFIDSKMELLPATIKENIFLSRNISDKKIKNILKEMNLSMSILGKKFSEVSQGEKQRIILASVLLANPKWLILDEGLSNLEKNTFIKLTRYLISKKDLSLIHISHSKHHEEVFYDKVFEIN